ncbi:MAG: 30S ribosomal protein S18 [Planctomycetes bacterium]|nr:30S ribosomal protein S18 [Planctomycetota bacterium]
MAFQRRGKPTKKKRKRSKRATEQAKCRFCRSKVKEIDYKDVATLHRLLSAQGKMFSRKRSGNCARHQRASALAVKRARQMALLPFVG